MSEHVVSETGGKSVRWLIDYLTLDKGLAMCVFLGSMSGESSPHRSCAVRIFFYIFINLIIFASWSGSFSSRYPFMVVRKSCLSPIFRISSGWRGPGVPPSMRPSSWFWFRSESESWWRPLKARLENMRFRSPPPWLCLSFWSFQYQYGSSTNSVSGGNPLRHTQRALQRGRHF